MMQGMVYALADYVLYCASKAGLIGATKALAKELAPAVCVNAVAPGIITWPDGFDQADKERQLSLIPAGRIGKPEELTSAIVFLCQSDCLRPKQLVQFF